MMLKKPSVVITHIDYGGPDRTGRTTWDLNEEGRVVYRTIDEVP